MNRDQLLKMAKQYRFSLTTALGTQRDFPTFYDQEIAKKVYMLEHAVRANEIAWWMTDEEDRPPAKIALWKAAKEKTYTIADHLWEDIQNA